MRCPSFKKRFTSFIFLLVTNMPHTCWLRSTFCLIYHYHCGNCFSTGLRTVLTHTKTFRLGVRMGLLTPQSDLELHFHFVSCKLFSPSFTDSLMRLLISRLMCYEKWLELVAAVEQVLYKCFFAHSSRALGSWHT